MDKDKAIALVLAYWVKDEWAYCYGNDKAMMERQAEALTVLTGTVWAIRDIPHTGWMIEPIQSVDWVEP